MTDNKDIITRAFLNYSIQLSKLNNTINDNLFGTSYFNTGSTLLTSLLPAYYPIRDLLLNPTTESFCKFIEKILGSLTSIIRLKISNT